MDCTYHALRALTTGLLVSIALVACSDRENVSSPIDTISASQRGAGMSRHEAPSFMTWNTYLGADIDPVIVATTQARLSKQPLKLGARFRHPGFPTGLERSPNESLTRTRIWSASKRCSGSSN